MSAARSRFVVCLAIALAAHALLLGLGGGAPAEDRELLRVTREAGPAAQSPADTDLRAVQDQRGEDERSQLAIRARSGAPRTQTAGAAEPTLTRYVVVAERAASEQPPAEPEPAAPAGELKMSQSLRVQAAREDARAEYLSAWQARIERYGSRDYPSALLAESGPRRLTMGVLLGRDGELREIHILRSSGSPELDTAAMRIVRRAAPFDPFNERLAATHEQLRFVYDWVFEADGGEGTANIE